MRIMGIDPGTARVGFGVIDYFETQQLTVVDCGCIVTDCRSPLSVRLQLIYREIKKTIASFNPTRVAIEKLFFSKNSRTVMSVGEARGVAVLAAAETGLPVFEYTPLQVKQAVVGYGRATKQQVNYMVKAILHLSGSLTPDDVADALAVAICDAYCVPGRELISRLSPKKV